MALREQIIETTECRRHNGQTAYGKWMPLADADPYIQDAVADTIAECISADMKHQPSPDESNTDESGRIDVGGEIWIYRR
jgi:hypothetical protein